MIGDSPGLSIATRNGQLYTKVPLLEPGTITLPIGPNHSIGPGKGEDKRIDLDESHVARLNARQGKRSGGLGVVSPRFGPEVVRGCGTAPPRGRPAIPQCDGTRKSGSGIFS